MSMRQPLTTGTTVRGVFFIVLGSALLLNTIAPSQYIQYLVGIAIVTGSLLMIGYGSILLRLHVLIARFIAQWSTHDDTHIQ